MKLGRDATCSQEMKLPRSHVPNYSSQALRKQVRCSMPNSLFLPRNALHNLPLLQLGTGEKNPTWNNSSAQVKRNLHAYQKIAKQAKKIPNIEE